MQPRLLSLCMIVRDEEALLPRCLGSVAAYVDEIVVADTGSSDDTSVCAVRHGARVLRVGWQDDFSMARNAALEAARGSWILVLDADEWIDGGSTPAALRRRLAAEQEEAYGVELVEATDAGTEQRSTLVRLFRNRPEHRYTGMIHEQITPSIAKRLGRTLLAPPPSGLVVGHDGYRLERRTARGKAERNLRLLRLQVERAPDDLGSRYFLLRELVPMRAGRAVPGSHIDEALRHAERLAAELGGLPASLQTDTIRLHAAALLAADRAPAARDLLERYALRGVEIDLLRADAELALAEDDDAGAARLERALERVMRNLEGADPGTLPFADPALGHALLCARAAELLVRLGRLDAAGALAAESRSVPGGVAPGWCVQGILERASGRPLAALAAWREALRADPRDPRIWMELGTFLLERGEAGEAARALSRATALAPGWVRAGAALAATRPVEGTGA